MKSNNNISKNNLKTLHYVYIIHCTLTGEYYFGKHSTDDKNDDYLGSGKELNRRIKEIGKEHFVITLFARFDGEEEAYDREEDLIRVFISDIKCLNKRISSRNSLCDHGVYKYPSGKTAKLHVNDPDVLSGLAVGANKGKKIKSKSPEEKVIEFKNRSESQKRRHQNESPEQKAKRKKKTLETNNNKTPEEKAQRGKNISKGKKGKPNGRTGKPSPIKGKKNSKISVALKGRKKPISHGKNVSLALKGRIITWGIALSEAKKIKFTQEESDFIFEQKALGLSINKITKAFNKNFNKDISRKPIDRILKI